MNNDLQALVQIILTESYSKVATLYNGLLKEIVTQNYSTSHRRGPNKL